MQHNVKIALVGTGKMGIEYTKVLKHLDADFTVFGNSKQSCEVFHEKTGIPAKVGGVEALEKCLEGEFDVAINAVSIQNLHSVNKVLRRKKIKKILLEKPAALKEDEFNELAKYTDHQIYIGFNRRYFASVLKLEELIKQDGGVTSFNFDFTEWSDGILVDFNNRDVLSNWLVCNSSHVIDLAFFIGGKPQDWSRYCSNPSQWHPAGMNFMGAGVSSSGALFSYKANWDSAGRWGVELNTKNSKFILMPMEKLQLIKRNSVQVQDVEFDERDDVNFKPGLYKMVQDFLSLTPTNRLCTLVEYLEQRNNVFLPMAYR